MLGTGDVYSEDVEDQNDVGGMVLVPEIVSWKRAGGFHSSKKRWSSGWITIKFGRRRCCGMAEATDATTATTTIIIVTT